eukprot:g3005.t1
MGTSSSRATLYNACAGERSLCSGAERPRSSPQCGRKLADEILSRRNLDPSIIDLSASGSGYVDDNDDYEDEGFDWPTAIEQVNERGGFPAARRGAWWRWMVHEACRDLGVRDVDSATYEELVRRAERGTADDADTEEAMRKTAASIDLDLPRLHAFETDVHYSVYADLMERVRRILLAFSVRNPAIGYCQGMDRLACLFAMSMREADSFAALVLICECVFKDHYGRKLQGVRGANDRLTKVVAARFPGVLAKLNEHGLDLLYFTSQWFVLGYIDCVSTSALMKIWDLVFLYSRLGVEAARVPLAVAVATFRLAEEDFERCADIEDIREVMHRALQLELRVNEKRFLRLLREEIDNVPRIGGAGGRGAGGGAAEAPAEVQRAAAPGAEGQEIKETETKGGGGSSASNREGGALTMSNV